MLLCDFDTFSDDLQVKAVCHADNGAHNRLDVVIVNKVTHKRLIDLELVQRQFFEVLQG